MNARLHEINHNLHSLGEAHRLGRISRNDYRAARRQLLDSLCEPGGGSSRDVASPGIFTRWLRGLVGKR